MKIRELFESDEWKNAPNKIGFDEINFQVQKLQSTLHQLLVSIQNLHRTEKELANQAIILSAIRVVINNVNEIKGFTKTKFNTAIQAVVVRTIREVKKWIDSNIELTDDTKLHELWKTYKPTINKIMKRLTTLTQELSKVR